MLGAPIFTYTHAHAHAHTRTRTQTPAATTTFALCNTKCDSKCKSVIFQSRQQESEGCHVYMDANDTSRRPKGRDQALQRVQRPYRHAGCARERLRREEVCNDA